MLYSLDKILNKESYSRRDLAVYSLDYHTRLRIGKYREAAFRNAFFPDFERPSLKEDFNGVDFYYRGKAIQLKVYYTNGDMKSFQLRDRERKLILEDKHQADIFYVFNYNKKDHSLNVAKMSKTLVRKRLEKRKSFKIKWIERYNISPISTFWGESKILRKRAEELFSRLKKKHPNLEKAIYSSADAKKQARLIHRMLKISEINKKLYLSWKAKRPKYVNSAIEEFNKFLAW